MRSREWALILLLIIASTPVTAATLTGTVYDEQLAVLTNVIITIDTQPVQRVVSMDGQYRFNVPPGNYTLIIQAPLRGNKTSTETVSVKDEGTFQFDLFFFPGSDEDFLEDLPGDDELVTLTEQPTTKSILNRFLFVLAIALAALAITAALRYRSQRIIKEFFETPNELDRVLTLIRKAGGRITQKALRQQLPDSEAKVSLMIAELEAQGLVRKIKKGRGNIIVLETRKKTARRKH